MGSNLKQNRKKKTCAFDRFCLTGWRDVGYGRGPDFSGSAWSPTLGCSPVANTLHQPATDLKIFLQINRAANQRLCLTQVPAAGAAWVKEGGLDKVKKPGRVAAQ